MRLPVEDALDAQLRASRRMRTLATGLLALMAVSFAAASWGAHRWPALGYLRAFAEAGMVGACADWFAVTALFRRPLGLPIPHTGLVPRNKDRIGEALGDFIADNFLTEAVLDQRLRAIELAAWGGAWLRRPGAAAGLAERLAAFVPDILDALPPGAMRAILGSAALAAAEAAPAADLAAGALGAAWSGGRAQAAIEYAAGRLRAVLAERQEVILERVQAQSYKWLPGFVDRMIARKIGAGVLQLLTDVCDPAHPWRRQAEVAVQDWIVRLRTEPELRVRAEAVKRRLLADPQLRGGLEALWADLERALATEVRERPERLTAWIEGGLTAVGSWLRENQAVRETLDAWSRATVRGVIAPRRREIGGFIAAVVSSWDTCAIVDKLEQQVGRDLQYIRINGTLVGGLVGLLIYAASRLLGL